MQASKTFSCDQRMGLLVAGLHLVCCWRYLSAALEGFESKGLSCLWEIWVTAMIAFAVGQIAKYFTPPKAADLDDLDLAVQSEQLGSSDASSLLPGHYKEGTELGVPQHASTGRGAKGQIVLQGGPGSDLGHEVDDMTAMKRRAQEEAAAKLAKYRAEVQSLLASIRSSSSSSRATVDAQLLYRLADQLFVSSINPCEFVEMGGVPVVLNAVRSLTRALGVTHSAQQQQQQRNEIEEEPGCQQLKEQQAGAMPAMLQASWVLLQLSHGSPACKAALQDPQCSSTLLAAAQAVQTVQEQQPVQLTAAANASESTLRNIWWTLLSMLDRTAPRGSNQQHGADAAPTQQQQQQQAAAAALQQQLYCQYEQYGAVPMLQQLLSLKHGLSAGWVAAAQLGIILQLAHQQQQQQGGAHLQANTAAGQQQRQQHEDESVLSRLSQACVQALLQEESVAGLVYLMSALHLEDQQQQQQQQQLSGRLRVLVEGLLHFLLTFQGPSLLQLLLEMRLLGSFAAHSSPRLGRLLVCQLLSSKGQEVMAAVEENYEVDVPLGLAQVIPLKVHVKVPAPTQQQQQQQEAGDGTAAAAEAGGQAEHATPAQQQQQAASEDLYTDIMACRLLLQHERLGELLSAFCEELSTAPDHQQQQAAAAAAAANPVAAAALATEQESSVVTASLGLLHHLMSRDLQLQAPKHVRGDAVFASVSSCSSRSLDEALAMPDANGVYSRVLAGMVPADKLPARSSSSSSSSGTDLTLPAATAAASAGTPAAADTAGTSQAAVVVFEFGQLQHSMSAASYHKVKRCSPLVASILSKVKPHVGGCVQPVTVLTIPHFTNEGNCWVLQCLERWVDTQRLSGFSALQAAKLWVASDFLQVDDLQVACEDVIVAGLRADPQGNIPLAVELCARHVDSSGRLLRLLVQQLLKDVSSPYGDSAAAAAAVDAGSSQQQQQCPLQLLRALLIQHAGLLLPVIHAELRDRLVTHCMLNAGLDGEDPSDLVG